MQPGNETRPHEVISVMKGKRTRHSLHVTCDRGQQCEGLGIDGGSYQLGNNVGEDHSALHCHDLLEAVQGNLTAVLPGEVQQERGEDLI